MQLASHGARGLPRNASNMIPGGSAARNSSRSIHIPSFARFKPPTSAGTAKQLISQTRTLLTRFIGHLTAPGLQAHVSSSLAQSLRGSAPGRMSSIHERLSYPVRNALARPIQPHYFPRAPTFASRSVAQVGLGSARNFSSGRPVFQNLIENVPIAGRAFYEADWEINMKKERDSMKKKTVKAQKKVAGKEMLKSNKTLIRSTVSELETVPEMDQYFAAPVTPAVTTYLLIPLAPTPSGRVPLPPDVPAHASLLPLSNLASIHNSHEMHSLRVSALFSRLDAANVWNKGVVCSSYATRADAEGVCNILKVEFIGWTMAEVRSVIGESGTGWCVIEEVESQRVPDEEDSLSETSSNLSAFSSDIAESVGSAIEIEPAHSLILPTLDFRLLPPSSPSLSRSESYDIFSDTSLESDPWEDSFSDEGPIEPGYLSFSSDFASRVNAENQWSTSREVLV